MAVGHQVARALSALWLARVAGIALNLLFVPLLFRRIAPGELGAWLLMGQAGAIIALMDFGITGVFTRRVAMASTREQAQTEVADLFASARPIYACAAALVFTGSLTAGWFFWPKLGLNDDAGVRVGLAWAVLCVSYAYNLYGGMWWGATSGFGHLAAVSVQNTVLGVASAAAQAAVVLLGGGVIALALCHLAGSVVQRWVMLRLLRSREPHLFSTAGRARPGLAPELLRTSSRWWLTDLGAIVLLRTDQFFVAAFQQASQIPAYYAAYSLLFTGAAGAMALAEAAGVFVSRMWREDRPELVHALVVRSTRIGLTLMLCGAGLMAVIGDSVIAVWVGPGHFVGRPTLLVFCVTLVLYVQQSLLLDFSRATENERYAPCYLAGGALNLLATWLLAAPFGVLGVALGTLVAQLATTSWYVPRDALRRLRLGWQAYLRQVVLPAVQAGTLTCGVTLLAVWGLGDVSHVQRAVGGGMAGGVTALASLWFWAFDAEIRGTIGREARAAIRRWRASAA